MLFIAISLITILLVFTAWYILSFLACRTFNGAYKVEDVLCFMFDNRFRTLSIIRNEYRSEERGAEDYDVWRDSLDIERMCMLSYQIRYIWNNCVSKK